MKMAKICFKQIRENAELMASIINSVIVSDFKNKVTTERHRVDEVLGQKFVIFSTNMLDEEGDYLRYTVKFMNQGFDLGIIFEKGDINKGLTEHMENEIKQLSDRLASYVCRQISIRLAKDFLNQESIQLINIIKQERWEDLKELYPHLMIINTSNGYSYRVQTPSGALIRQESISVEFDQQMLPGLSCGFLDTVLNQSGFGYDSVVPSDGINDGQTKISHEHAIYDRLIEDFAVLGLLGHLDNPMFKQRLTYEDKVGGFLM